MGMVFWDLIHNGSICGPSGVGTGNPFWGTPPPVRTEGPPGGERALSFRLLEGDPGGEV